jgi:hypothetical protein
MTSPSTSLQVPASATATPSPVIAIDDDPPNQLELTAAGETEPSASKKLEQETRSDTFSPSDNEAVDELVAQQESLNKPQDLPNGAEQAGTADNHVARGSATEDHEAVAQKLMALHESHTLTQDILNGVEHAADTDTHVTHQGSATPFFYSGLPPESEAHLRNPESPPLSLFHASQGITDHTFTNENLDAHIESVASLIGAPEYLEPSPHLNDTRRIQAFAKWEFQDGEYYMNSWQMILGRDLAASRAAARLAEQRRKNERETSTHDPTTPVRTKHHESKYTRSIVSESGGIMRAGNSDEEFSRPRRRKSRKGSKKSGSTGSSSRNLSRRNSEIQANGVFPYTTQPQVLRSLTDGATPVDPLLLRPSPNDCPLVGIHPPVGPDGQPSASKGISRKHVKIAYNVDKHLFEAHVIGRNGLFVFEKHYGPGSVVPLRSGDRCQIGGVVMKFVLPDVAIGETGAEQRGEYDANAYGERYSEGGKEMSLDFDSEHRDGLPETSEDESEGPENESGEEEDEEEEARGEREMEDETMENDSGSGAEEGQKVAVDPSMQTKPNPPPKGEKRRGPGRPPKNGIMSKREQQLAKKEAIARAAAEAQQKMEKPEKPVQPTTEVKPGKNKVGRPRKHPIPDTPPIQKEKRKYTKRKPKEPKDPNVKQEGSGEDQPAKEKKEKKPPKPPRSPSPFFNEADLTPEQLAKPSANYVTLIHEAISNSEKGEMSLPQIYRAIQRKYPYFVVKTNTNGWQSSVRHNLSQHDGFRKCERDGKGWTWVINPDASFEKEKKRKSPQPQPPPGHMHQPIYQAGHPPHMMHGSPYVPGMMGPPPGYMLSPQVPPNFRPPHPPHYMPPAQPMNGQPLNPHLLQNGHPQSPIYPPTIPPQLIGAGGGTYSSPYAPKPSMATPPQSQPIVQQQATSQASPQASTITGTPSNQHQHPPQSQPQTPLHTKPHAPPQPPQQGQLTRPQPPSGSPPPPNAAVQAVIKDFKDNILKLLGRVKDTEAIFDSAVDQVLGYSTESKIPGNPHEDMIISSLRKILSAIPGSHVQAGAAQASPAQPQSDPQSARPANQNGPQGNTTQEPTRTGTERSGPSIPRPAFTQNRPSIARPPMMTPGMKRTNSGNAPQRASAPSSASPAPTTPMTSTVNGASTPKPAFNDARASPPALIMSANEHVTGQKRALEDADEMREHKRRSSGEMGASPPAVMASEIGQLAGQKRALEDAEDNTLDFKRPSLETPQQV